MSAEGQMPRFFAKINQKVNISRRSLIANFILCAIFLMFADNWAALMLFVTGFNIIGYMAAPVSMGAIAPKLRIFGLVVFVLLTLLLNTVDILSNIYLGVILAVLVIIFCFFEYKRVGIKTLMILVLPFIIFICATAPVENYIINAIAGAIFYIVVTDKRYVAYCKETANKDNIVED